MKRPSRPMCLLCNRTMQPAIRYHISSRSQTWYCHCGGIQESYLLSYPNGELDRRYLRVGEMEVWVENWFEEKRWRVHIKQPGSNWGFTPWVEEYLDLRDTDKLENYVTLQCWMGEPLTHVGVTG